MTRTLVRSLLTVSLIIVGATGGYAAPVEGGAYSGGGYPGGTYGYPSGYGYGGSGYNPGGLGGPASGLGVRPGLGFGGFGPGR